ncbi:LnmK family bifunctional acyltransferase/decarboxylase [Amycolatopsis minnesotensis]|uniref:LnmK N-terminal domain-containing protein n=1 Tax=Amycolatopsis minnesotensis TaxID=337894 RepID=A0ABN2PWV8_9PSEU
MTATTVVPDGTLTRDVVVAPGMCSGGSLIFGRIGDWTWASVAQSCGVNVYAARTVTGDPAYLSFYYYRVRGGAVVHPHGLTFGDELTVTSRVFQLGGQSVLTLHRLAPVGLFPPGEPLAAKEFYERPHPDCMYAENFNRWLARGTAGSNQGLTPLAPPDFAYEHLPVLPNEYSPRTEAGRARAEGGFHPSGPEGFAEVGQARTSEHVLDVVRDLNGAGLMYFASYFSVFDTALLASWRALGRTDERFLRRRVIDQRIGYFGNADPGTVFAVTLRLWRDERDPEREIADLVMRDRATGRFLAATAIETGGPA